MAEITASLVKELRELTGSGMMDCKKALTATEGNIEKAVDWLREKGISKAEQKQTRIAAEGIVDAYIHANGRIGVLLEVNIETDFAAKNEIFTTFVRDLCMQIAAMSPTYVSREEVPEDVLEKEREIIRAEALNSGKPEAVVDRIVEGRISKFYTENCLLDQPFIKDEDKTVGDIVKEKTFEIGEKISVRRFARYEMGEGIEKKTEDFAAEVMKQLK